MLQLEDLQLTSCVRCKTSILGNPKGHLSICYQLERLDEAIEELRGLGYESLDFEQIGLLIEFLLKTDLNGYIIAGVVKDLQEKEIATILCNSCNCMVDAYEPHECRKGIEI